MERHLAPRGPRQRPGADRGLAEGEGLDGGRVLTRAGGPAGHQQGRPLGLPVQGPVLGGGQLGGAPLEHPGHEGPLVAAGEGGKVDRRRLTVGALLVPGAAVDHRVARLLAAAGVGAGGHVGARLA